ncbi:MAG: K(+)-transporting ATPase subunit C [Bacteroidales bacterium]
MKSNLIKAIKITLAFCVFFAILYIAVLWLFAKIMGPNQGNVPWVTLNGKVVGAANVGQSFTKSIYFWGRPSAVNYAADASGASNKGVNDSVYLVMLSTRLDTFLFYHPYLLPQDVPAEMITASASGLDPDITPESAFVQIKRVAFARGMDETNLQKIVEQQIEKPFLSLLGPSKINVLKLNVAIDKADTLKQ